jgi:glycosyltransferase involved in cell wall biosynthesis
MGRSRNNLRVALVGGYSLDPSHMRGGVQAATAYLVKGLARIKGLELHVLTWRPPGWMGEEQFIQNGVYIHLLPPYPRFERLRGYHIYQSIFDLALAQIQPAVVHAQENTSDAYVALRSGYPTVVTVHGILAEDGKYHGSLRRRLRNYFDAQVIERKVMRDVRYLIAISRYVTGYYFPVLPPNLHVYHIPNAIDDQYFDINDNIENPSILYAGRVIPRKRVCDLIHAFAHVIEGAPYAQLRIAGETSSEPAYVETVRKQIYLANLNEHVKFLGALSESEILHEYIHCSMVVLASAQETLPMVLAQAMASGKPVVATRVGGVRDMVGSDEERGLLADVGDINALGEAMLRLLQDEPLRMRMGKAARAFSEENYHIDRVAQSTYDVYLKILAMEQ